MEYLDKLKKLIAGEAACACQYKFASENLVGGNKYSYLQSHFTEHFEEEWGHYSQLTEALMEREGVGNLKVSSRVTDALPKTMEMTSNDCDYLRKFFVKAEDAAVKAYEEFYDEIKEEDEDLADIVLSIIQDEKGHKLDFTRIANVAPKEEEESEEKKEEEEPFDMNAKTEGIKESKKSFREAFKDTPKGREEKAWWDSVTTETENRWKSDAWDASRDAEDSLEEFGKVYVDPKTDRPIFYAYVKTLLKDYGEPKK